MPEIFQTQNLIKALFKRLQRLFKILRTQRFANQFNDLIRLRFAVGAAQVRIMTVIFGYQRDITGQKRLFFPVLVKRSFKRSARFEITARIFAQQRRR